MTTWSCLLCNRVENTVDPFSPAVLKSSNVNFCQDCYQRLGPYICAYLGGLINRLATIESILKAHGIT